MKCNHKSTKIRKWESYSKYNRGEHCESDENVEIYVLINPFLKRETNLLSFNINCAVVLLLSVYNIGLYVVTKTIVKTNEMLANNCYCQSVNSVIIIALIYYLMVGACVRTTNIRI